MNSVSLLDSLKSSYFSEIDKLKEGSSELNDINDFFKRINSELENKSESVQKFQQKIRDDIQNFAEEKKKSRTKTYIKIR